MNRTPALMLLLLMASSTAAQYVQEASWTPEYAASMRIPSFTFGALPVGGVYVDPTQNGAGLVTDSVRNADGSTTFFAFHYFYEPSGTPTWMNLVGTVLQTSMSTYTNAGVYATATGPFQRAVAGQCFDCAYPGPPTVSNFGGPRTLNFLDGRTVQMPASGAAATRNFRLGRTLIPEAQLSSKLLESGVLWQCRQRHYWEGVENGLTIGTGSLCGWMRFERRVASLNWDYNDPIPTTFIQDGQGGHLPATMPAWLEIPGVNAVATQYQLEAVLSDDEVGANFNTGGAGFKVTASGRPDTGDVVAELIGTLLVHPQTGYIHAIQHCVGCTGGAGNIQRDNAGMRNTGRLMWVGLDAEGNERLLLRMWSRSLNGWVGEIELTRVPDQLRREILPNYVPSADPR